MRRKKFCTCLGLIALTALAASYRGYRLIVLRCCNWPTIISLHWLPMIRERRLAGDENRRNQRIKTGEGSENGDLLAHRL